MIKIKSAVMSLLSHECTVMHMNWLITENLSAILSVFIEFTTGLVVKKCVNVENNDKLI